MEISYLSFLIIETNSRSIQRAIIFPKNNIYVLFIKDNKYYDMMNHDTIVFL